MWNDDGKAARPDVHPTSVGSAGPAICPRSLQEPYAKRPVGWKVLGIEGFGPKKTGPTIPGLDWFLELSLLDVPGIV